MLGPIFVVSIVLICAVLALWRPHIGVIAFYGMYLLQPEWNWRWTMLRDFQYQDTLAIATLLGILINFGVGNRINGPTLNSFGALAAFLAVAFLSSTQSINPAASTFYLNILWRAFLMAFLAAVLLDTREKITAMVWAIVVAQGYNSYQINLQYFQDGVSFYVKHAWGDFTSNHYSLLTVPILAFSLSLVVYSKHRWQQALAGSIAILQIHQIMLLESRGCMLAGVLMGAVFVIHMPKTRNATFGITALLLAGFMLAGPSVIAEFSSSFGDDSGELDDSAQSRLTLWKVGWRITTENPLLGTGPDCGKYLVPGYWTKSHGIRGDNKALHNLVFEISTGCGIPATILYVGHFFIIWLALVRARWLPSMRSRDNPLEMPMLAVISGQAGYWTASMFSSGALLETTYISIAIGAATVCVYRRMYLPQQEKTSRRAPNVVPAVDEMSHSAI